MADVRGLRRPALRRRRWRPVSDTDGGSTLEYALVVFVASTIVGFVLPHFGISLMALIEHLTAVMDAIAASLGG